MTPAPAPPPPAPQGPSAVMLAGAGVLSALVVIGGVWLVAIGRDAAQVVSLLGGIVGVLVVLLPVYQRLAEVDRKQDEQSQALTRVEEQTNGVLTERIREAVSAALTEHHGPPAPPHGAHGGE